MTLCADSLKKTSDHQSEIGGSYPTSALQIKLMSKQELRPLLDRHHYLSTISKSFKTKINYGLIGPNGAVLGACIFTGFPVPELVVGLFGLPRTDQQGFWELSRLCLDPSLQKEKNMASWFVSRCLRFLRRDNHVRAVLSYADSQFHTGTVYKALGFGYFGLSSPKNDYFVPDEAGVFQKLSRGPTTGVVGEWRKRSQKHRYLLMYDKSLTPKWERAIYPV